MSEFMKPDIKWASGIWERRDYPTIMSGWVVRYQARGSHMEINASREAVCVEGVRFVGQVGLDATTDILHRALRQHLHLKRSDQNDPLQEKEYGTPCREPRP